MVETIATRKGVGPTDLEPLYETVDPQCLETLFPASSGDAVRQFTFEYEDHVVKVSEDRSVEVAPAGGTNPDFPGDESGTTSGRGEPEAPD